MSTSVKEITYSPFRWFVLLTLFIVTGTTAVALIAPAPMIPGIFASFLPDPSIAGDILSGNTPLPDGALNIGEIANVAMLYFNLAVAVGALGGGWFIDKFGFLAVYFFGISMIAIGWILMPSVGQTVGGVVLLRVIQGLGTGPIMASSASVAARRFPVNERAIVTGTQGAAMAAGVGIGQLTMGGVLEAHAGSFQDALFSLWPIAAVALVMALIVAFGPKQAEVRAEDMTPAERSAVQHQLRAALRHPVTWAAIACVFILSWVYQAFNDLSPTYLTNGDIGVGFAAGGTMLAIAQAFNFAGAFAAGAFTEKLMRGRVRPGIILGFSMGAIFGLAMLAPFATSNAVVMGIVVCIAGFFFAWINPNALAYLAKSYPQSAGKLGGYAMGLGIFGGSAGVWAGAHALGATGHFTLSIVIMSVVCALGIIPALFLKQAKVDHASLVTAEAETATVESI
ncbi:MFS transporter [Actinotalea sp. M2MS4P-6]|uniref:MFS transporter n=1 Tax=Actinotalea sp. M2MS4P-6 TaxID=2983762 RepID=UPI0021E49CE1|nr:MFS transporter [Actinotalea sp. M2MS4P-6]MCV2394309.1 MFS transporter [Actinotalea sp. M2MS4P-6]